MMPSRIEKVEKVSRDAVVRLQSLDVVRLDELYEAVEQVFEVMCALET